MKAWAGGAPAGRRGAWLVAGAVALAAACGCRRGEFRGPSVREGRAAQKPASEPTVRVALARGQGRLELGCTGECEVWAGPPERVALRAGSAKVAVTAGPKGFVVGGREEEGAWLAVRPRGTAQVEYGGHGYPGELRVWKDRDGLLLVNAAPMERYVAAVVEREMRPEWPPEALKAQAVAARTYVLFQMRWSRGAAYDVLAASTDQSYGGGAVDPRAGEAAARTRGKALVRGGAVVPAYYHSTCGGHTANAAEAFDRSDLAFLRGVACRFCAGSPYAQWEAELTAEEVGGALADRGLPQGAVTAMQVLGRYADGRVEAVRVLTESGRQDFKARDFRAALGGRRVKSTRFTMAPAGGTKGGFRLRGEGFGHGAGMCQYGARGMARAGARYGQILAHYYSGVELAQVYD